MRANFDGEVALVLLTEGGYTVDRGGPTYRGITLAAARDYWGDGFTIDQLRGLSTDQINKFYFSQYFVKAGCDFLPSGVDYAVFDYAVNSGVGRANRVLANLLGLPSVVVAGNVKAAALREPRDLIEKICDERMAFLKGLSNWPVDEKGWTTRVAAVREHSLDLVGFPSRAPNNSTVTAPLRDLKSVPGKPSAPPVTTVASLGTAASAGLTAFAHYKGAGAGTTAALGGGLLTSVFALIMGWLGLHEDNKTKPADGFTNAVAFKAKN